MRNVGRAQRVFAGALALVSVIREGAAEAVAGEPIFTDVTADAGLDFVHFNGMSGELYFPEMTGQGGALLDYDGDGDLDLYCVQGAMLGPGKTLEDALFPPRGALPPGDRLYRNDLAAGAGGTPRVRLVDVTAAAGIEATGYGMAAAAGDFDGDGAVDLYVANDGPNQLLRNRGDGTFEDVTAASGTDDPRWSTAATFTDVDGDGRLDLFVVNYVEFSVEANPECFAESSRRDYCGPSSFPPLSDKLLRNRGDGTFEDVSARSRVGLAEGAGLGVLAADLDGDGRTDLYVANDGMPNFLWLAAGDGTFRDEALLAGVAVNREGRPEASMGVDAADFDADGDPDLFLTHLTGETHTLYVNAGGGLFEDRTIESGLGPPGFPATGFGTRWIDFENDGFPDLLVANGAVRIQEPLARQGDPFPLEQRNQLFRNLGGRRFVEVTEEGGEALQPVEVSRGVAAGDLDGDGDADAVVFNNNGPARLLRNDAGNGGRWLKLQLVDDAGRDMLGAVVELLREDRSPVWFRAGTDGSYASASDPRVLIGLGDSAIAGVRVRWPDGTVQEWRSPPAGKTSRLRQGR